MLDLEARVIVVGKALMDAIKADSGVRDATPVLEEFHQEPALTMDPSDLMKVIASEGGQYLFFFDTVSAVFDRFVELDHRTSVVLRYASHVNYWRSQSHADLIRSLDAKADAWDALNPSSN